MTQWISDVELFDLIIGRLYTPVVGDILDRLGLIHQFTPRPIQRTSSTAAFQKYGIL